MDTVLAPPTRHGPRVTLWLLRLLISVLLVAVLTQPVLAGRFLAGDVDAIALHGALGGTLAFLCLLTIAATLLYVLAGRGRLIVIPVVAAMFVAVVVQISAGYARTLELHVPLGVAITLAALLLTVWVWSPSAGRARAGRMCRR